MKRKSIITLLAISMICLSSCGKSDDVEPVVSEAVETADQQEPEEEPEPVVEDIVEEPEQEVEEVAEVEDNDNVEPEAEEEPDQQEEIAIEELDKTMYAIQSVNVREGDSTEYNVVGQLYTNEAVYVTGRSVNTGWLRIDFGNDSAFVSNNYLSDNPVEVQQVEQAQQNNNAVNNSSNVGADVGTGLTPEAQAWADSHGITTMTWDGTVSEKHTSGMTTGLTAE